MTFLVSNRSFSVYESQFIRNGKNFTISKEVRVRRKSDVFVRIFDVFLMEVCCLTSKLELISQQLASQRQAQKYEKQEFGSTTTCYSPQTPS